MAAPSFIVSVGSAGATNPCVPDAELWVTPAASPLSLWYYAGNCPASGSVICANSVLANGRTITFVLRQSAGGTPEMDAICFQDQRMLSGVDPGGAPAPGGAASSVMQIVPFEFTGEQQAQAYQDMLDVAGAFALVLGTIWAAKVVIGLINSGGGDRE